MGEKKSHFALFVWILICQQLCVLKYNDKVFTVAYLYKLKCFKPIQSYIAEQLLSISLLGKFK